MEDGGFAIGSRTNGKTIDERVEVARVLGLHVIGLRPDDALSPIHPKVCTYQQVSRHLCEWPVNEILFWFMEYYGVCRS